MMSVLTAARNQIRWHRVVTMRARQRHLRARITERLSELDALATELDLLIAENVSWPLDELMIRMFKNEIAEARVHFQEKRYWLAKKHRKQARATLLCIKRNIRSMRLYPSAKPAIN